MYPRFPGTHNEVNLPDEFTKIFSLMRAIFLKLEKISSLCFAIMRNEDANFNSHILFFFNSTIN